MDGVVLNVVLAEVDVFVVDIRLVVGQLLGGTMHEHTVFTKDPALDAIDDHADSFGFRERVVVLVLEDVVEIFNVVVYEIISLMDAKGVGRLLPP